MAAITKLPPELVHEILKSFEDDKATLYRLSLASAYFAPVAQQLLLRHLDLSVDTPLDGVETSFDKIIKLFNEKPNLSAHVQTLVLSSRHKCLESSQSIVRALNLLNRITSLRSLDMKNTLMLPPWDIDPPMSGFFLERNPLTRLTKLKLKSPWISWGGLAILLYLPNLEHLSLAYLPPGDVPSTLSEYRGKICPVRTLELGSWRGQSGLPLKGLLKLTNELEVLDLKMDSSTQFYSHRFTALEISKALVPVHGTLKVLKIKGSSGNDALAGSRLDLSRFKVLEKVDVLSILLFSSRRGDPLSEGLYKLLPRSLRELQINFGGENRIIPLLPLTPSVLEHGQVNWLTELALNKSTRYPNFSSLTLQERNRPPSEQVDEHFDTRNCRELELPEGLKLEFKTNATALKCWVRKEARA